MRSGRGPRANNAALPPIRSQGDLVLVLGLRHDLSNQVSIPGVVLDEEDPEHARTGSLMGLP